MQIRKPLILRRRRMRKEAVRIRPCFSLHELAIAGDLHCVPDLKSAPSKENMGIVVCTTGAFVVALCCRHLPNSVDDLLGSDECFS